MTHRLTAEFIGTFWLVFGGCGAAVFAADPAGDNSVGIGYLGVSLAFGLTVLTGVYAFGTISGGHFNPAVTLGAAIAKRPLASRSSTVRGRQDSCGCSGWRPWSAQPWPGRSIRCCSAGARSSPNARCETPRWRADPAASQPADVLHRQPGTPARQAGQTADLERPHRPIAVRAHRLE